MCSRWIQRYVCRRKSETRISQIYTDCFEDIVEKQLTNSRGRRINTTDLMD